MSVLAHIHTMNDAAVIEQLLEALRKQTRPPDAILLVDNASTDGTLDRIFPKAVTIVRNPKNLGTSGAIRTGFAHALEHGFDWTWIFDADSVPEPDALERLLAFFERLSPAKREQVCFLGGLPLTAAREVKEPPISLEAGRMRRLPVVRVEEFTQCDCALWSGSLFRMAAVARIGLPTADYMLDIAEVEYGYRAQQLGLTSYIVHNGVIHHDVGRTPGAERRLHQFGPMHLRLYEISPTRCYYSVRNMIYFWLYQYQPRRIAPALRGIVRSLATTANFAIRPISYRRQLIACIRGIRDGLTRHMERRY
jgi:rhamnopyranosyl-N-acetylglucosaminyl-diphospho-decaprenol beta-1,3/1,4-galactofuranosyltransferase